MPIRTDEELTRSLCRFFFTDTATTEIYTLSLHDALPIFVLSASVGAGHMRAAQAVELALRELAPDAEVKNLRSEEHTSELQSQSNLVCRLLLEKKKN